MMHMYWSPRKVSRRIVALLAALSVLGYAALELFKQRVEQPLLPQKLAAAKLAQDAMQEIKAERLRRGHPVEPEFDLAETGVLGTVITPVTSISGHLQSKQTSLNPNFAAVVVDMLGRAGIREGDCVAIGYSGSFPAINTCVCAAVDTLKLKPVAIASATASQFGANFPDFLWVDMEHHLYDRGLISFHSKAASMGGYEDRAVGMSGEAKQLIREGIERNGLPLIDCDSFQSSVEERMRLYGQHAGGRRIKAYINVGGGTVSVGRSLGKKLYQPGLNLEPPQAAGHINSVMHRFASSGAPVIHMVQIQKLADRFSLPPAPEEMPEVGEGSVYVRYEYSRGLAGAILFSLLTTLVLAARPDDRSRFMGIFSKRDSVAKDECQLAMVGDQTPE